MPYSVEVLWEKKPDETFVDNKYSRSHTWIFDGGIELTASSSPHVVPLPFSNEFAVDPEEAFVAALSSCHMLWFLSIAAEKGYLVARYCDRAGGVLGKDEQGRLAITRVDLCPEVVFGGSLKPSREQLEELHHLAHQACFIANSVRTVVEIKPAG